jgi:hypothetical protein
VIFADYLTIGEFGFRLLRFAGLFRFRLSLPSSFAADEGDLDSVAASSL